MCRWVMWRENPLPPPPASQPSLVWKRAAFSPRVFASWQSAFLSLPCTWDFQTQSVCHSWELSLLLPGDARGQDDRDMSSCYFVILGGEAHPSASNLRTMGQWALGLSSLTSEEKADFFFLTQFQYSELRCGCWRSEAYPASAGKVSPSEVQSECNTLSEACRRM